MAVEFVGIELQLRGAEGVQQDLANLDRLLKSLGGRKQVKTGLDQLKRDALAAGRELESLKKKRDALGKALDSGKVNQSEFWVRQYEELGRSIEEATKKNKDLKQAIQEVGVATRTAGQSFGQTFNAMSSRIAHAGAAMQSLGNAMTRLTSPFTKIATGALFGIGMQGISKFTEGLTSGFNRYDTMKKYPKLMAEYETETYSAQKSIQDLDESVQGLPIALDDAVGLAQRYTLSLGDMERGTNLAIATNNAFLASMSTESQRYQGMMQMTDLLNGKELTSKEWQSLGASMGKAINEIGKELGYGADQMDEFRRVLYAGEISTQDFLNALEKVGTGSGALVALAKESMDTWEAFFSRIGTAASRMLYNTVLALDEVSQLMTGMDVNQLLDSKFIPAIDKATASVIAWIKAHPEEITRFFKDLSSIDIGGFIQGVVRGFGDLANLASRLSRVFGDKGLSGLGRSMIWMNMLGRGLSILGGGLKGLRHPLGLILTVISRAGGGIKNGIFGKLAELFGGVTGMKMAKKVADAAPSVASSFKLAANRLSGALTAFGTVALGVGTGAFTFWSFKTMIKNLREIVNEVNSFTAEDWRTANDVLMSMIAFVSTFAWVSGEIGAAIGGLSGLAESPIIIGTIATSFVIAMADLDAHMVAGVFKSFFDMTKYLKDGLETLAELGTIKVKKRKVEDALELMGMVSGVLSGDYMSGKDGGQGSGTRSLSARKAWIKDISIMVEDIKKTLGDLERLPEIESDTITKSTTKVSEAIEAMKEIYNTLMDDSKLEEIDKSQGSEKWQRSKNEGLIDFVAGMISTIKGTVADFKELESLDVDLDVAKGNIVDVGTKMAEIFSEIESQFSTYLMEYDTSSGMGTGRQTATKGVSETNVANAKKIQTIFDSFAMAVKSIRQAYQAIMGQEGEMDFDVDAFQEIMDGVTGDGGIVSMMHKLFEELSRDFGDSDVDIETPMAEFKAAIESLKSIYTTLSEMQSVELTESDTGGIAIIEQINALVEQLKSTFNEEAIAAVTEQINSFVSSVNELLTQIQSIQGMTADNPLELAITLTPTGDMGAAVINKLNQIAKGINLAWDMIPESLSKKIEIIVSYDTSRVQSFPNLGVPTRLSTGGFVGKGGNVLYRAKGGDTIFKRRGTDTVPAMLTPGEYVHNKRAVDFFGIDFMRKVNRLDMKGAMNELLARAGHMANVGSQTIINNTYNNQRLTQNINTNSPGFATKVASRFSGAF